MSNTKHTPGPWTTWSDREENEVYGRVIGMRINAGRDRSIGTVHGFQSAEDGIRQEAFANASLISAAPDMLQALLVLRSYFEGNGQIPNALAPAIAAIAKATAQ